MMTSRTLSTRVCVAASISRTSMSRPSAISTHASQRPHGSAVGPFTQFRARARIRAVVVLPTPRGPANTNACAIRLLASALLQRPRDGLLADDSSNVCGRHLRARTWYDIQRASRRRVVGSQLNRGPEGLRHISGSV